LVLSAWFKSDLEQHFEQTNISISGAFHTSEFGMPLATPA
jgi:hypothetical protein